jgi:hypothetical protein
VVPYKNNRLSESDNGSAYASKEISYTARDLKERGVIRGTATAFNDSVRCTRETSQTVCTLSEAARKAAHQTATAIAKASETARGCVTGAAEKAKEPVRERAEKAKTRD